MGKKGKSKGKGHGRPVRDAVRLERPAGHTTDAGSELARSELAANLVSIGAQLQRQLGHGADEDGLTRARLSALGRLVLGGPCTLGQLAAHEGVRPPTMTRLVQSMEAAGLVARQPHPTDGRSILLHATPSGEVLLASGQASRLKPLADAIGGLGRDERRDVAHAAEVLGRFLRDLSEARRRA
jgi:DNA-binding MarR family transcriptional regulator